jgi:hypothetical protein
MLRCIARKDIGWGLLETCKTDYGCRRGALVSAVLVVGAPLAATATTRTVSPGQSIQAAINVSPRNMRRNHEHQWQVHLDHRQSERPERPVRTVPQAVRADAAVIIISITPWVSDLKTIISGLTIVKGNAPDEQGDGITVSANSAPVIRDITISNDAATSGGGIMLGTGANVIIVGSTATSNSKFGGSGVGGGVSIFDNTVATLTSNIIRGNAASNLGGGVSSAENANTTLTGNFFTGNHLTAGDNSKQGGGLYAANSTLTATNNQFFGNTAGVGGGIALTNVPATLVNNTLVSNHAINAAGGAIYVASGSVALMNDLLTQNDGYQLFFQIDIGPNRLDNNLITTPKGIQSQERSGLYFD